MAGYLAYIIPVDSGAHPSHPISLPGDPGFGQIPGFTPGTPPPRPQPQPPLGIWGPGFPYPDQGLPGSQPRPDQGLPPFPAHPIYIPIMPPAGAGGEEPTHPIYFPVYPSHPIVLPPDIPPDQAEAIKEKLEFWLGNLPPYQGQPQPTPVGRRENR